MLPFILTMIQLHWALQKLLQASNLPVSKGECQCFNGRKYFTEEFSLVFFVNFFEVHRFRKKWKPKSERWGQSSKFTSPKEKFYIQSLLQNIQHYIFLNNWNNTVFKKISKKVNAKGEKSTQSRCFLQWNQITFSRPISSHFWSSFVWEHDGNVRKSHLPERVKSHSSSNTTKQLTNIAKYLKTSFFSGQKFQNSEQEQ